jgi:hypothetical protein
MVVCEAVELVAQRNIAGFAAIESLGIVCTECEPKHAQRPPKNTFLVVFL